MSGSVLVPPGPRPGSVAALPIAVDVPPTVRARRDDAGRANDTSPALVWSFDAREARDVASSQ